MNIMEQFVEWEAKVKGDINHIDEIMSKRLPDDPTSLIEELEDAEAWYARAGYLLAEANSWLDKSKAYLIPEREGRTEMDRKVILDKEIAPIRLVRDHIESLCDGIKQRLILGMSILNQLRQFNENRIYENKLKKEARPY